MDISPNAHPYRKLSCSWWRAVRRDPNLSRADQVRLVDILHITRYKYHKHFSWAELYGKPSDVDDPRLPCKCDHPIEAGQAKVSHRYLAEAWGVGARTVRRWFKRMERLGYLRAKAVTDIHALGTCRNCGTLVTWSRWDGQPTDAAPGAPPDKARHSKRNGGQENGNSPTCAPPAPQSKDDKTTKKKEKEKSAEQGEGVEEQADPVRADGRSPDRSAVGESNPSAVGKERKRRREQGTKQERAASGALRPSLDEPENGKEAAVKHRPISQHVKAQIAMCLDHGSVDPARLHEIAAEARVTESRIDFTCDCDACREKRRAKSFSIYPWWADELDQRADRWNGDGGA